MKTISLRTIPPKVENAIRARARQKKISVSRAVIELLEERVGILKERRKTIHDDLDELAGAASRGDRQADRQGSLAVKRLLVDASADTAFMRGDGEALHALREADEIYLNPIVHHPAGSGHSDSNEMIFGLRRRPCNVGFAC